MYSSDLIEEVVSRNDIVDVISGYIKLKKNGSSYVGLCPFFIMKNHRHFQFHRADSCTIVLDVELVAM